MSNVIDFLERMGQDAQLRHASRNYLEATLAETQIDPELQAAILAKDQQQLEALLGQDNFCCVQCPSREDEDDDTEEAPSKESDEISSRTSFRFAASLG